MEKQIREILEREFGNKEILKRKGRGNQQLSYIAGYNIIARLNEAFEGDWSFDPVVEFKDDTFIVVKGTLTAAGVSKSQFGSEEIKHYKDGGAIVDIGFDFKAAATDALKKCATLFGIALHLYGSIEKPSKSQQQENRDNFNDAFDNGGEPPPQEDAITSTAAKGCFACAATLRIPEDVFDTTLYETFGVTTKKLISLEKWEHMHKGLQSIVYTVTKAAKDFAGIETDGALTPEQKDELDKAVVELVTYLNETKGEWKEKSAALKDKGNTGSRREIFDDLTLWKEEQAARDEAEKDMPE